MNLRALAFLKLDDTILTPNQLFLAKVDSKNKIEKITVLMALILRVPPSMPL